jgi:mannose-6-phosphate isomerase-like protein (cupin superfamily)
VGDTITATPFKFEHVASGRGKDIVFLCNTDRMVAAVQVLREGGENNLHRHDHLDGFWYVLKGRVRFYTTGDELVGEFGPGEGVLVPRGYPYWFETAGDETLELLQVETSDIARRSLREMASDRIDMAPRPASMAASVRASGIEIAGEQEAGPN